ncbi:MAG TPA: helicase HerA-like domain-containing protein [Candidatus Nanopelagicales bacterium]
MVELRLGGVVDAATHTRTSAAAAVPSEELTTHGVIVGMTGSGKTGLGVVLIEECLRSGVPALLIDPKGDLTNLALTFPNLAPAEFEPWVNASDAQKAGQSVPDFAAAQAALWREGLGGWGLGTPDVAALHEGVEVTIYTPGSSHGVGLNIIGTLDVPEDLTDLQAVQEEIDAYVSSLLHLVGIDADPLSSREHILLSTIINHAWGQGRALDLATLVASVQQPPVRKVGVLELDTYYPAEDRMGLAMKLNGLLASPAFASWLGGERIDIGAMLRTPDGRPRCAIVTTAHLDDEQRQSATSVILAKLISWMRRQSGTSDLRALLYMDEVAGYLPPVGNPPTKEPLMLLLKQARAFGVGVVLSTQNPVDVDYKALSNAGTWLIGRLQTEQDKNRLLDGLTSAAGGVDPRAVGDTISGLGKREFVLKRASRDAVEVMTTRWAMSYLRGPLTRDQVASLTAVPSTAPEAQAAPGAPAASGAAAAAPTPTAPPAAPPAPASPAPTSPPGPLADDETPVPPGVAAGIPVHFLDPAASWAASVGAVPGHRLTAGAIARVLLHFDDAKAGVVLDQEYEAVLTPLSPFPSAQQFRTVDYDDRDLLPTPPAGAIYRLPPTEVAAKTWWTALQRDLADTLQRSMTVAVPSNPELRLYGRIGETAEDFAARCRAAAADGADRQVAALQAKYQAKLAAAQRKLVTATSALERQREARTSAIASDAVGMLGGLFGGRRSSVSASARRASSAQSKVSAAEDKVEELQAVYADLQAELDAESAEIRAGWDAKAAAVGQLDITLAKSDVKVTQVGLVWIPTGT